MIYSGPVDAYLITCYGKLPYRSLSLSLRTSDQEYFQPTGTVNYPNEQAFTRISDFKYITGQKTPKTSIVYEFPEPKAIRTIRYRARKCRNIQEVPTVSRYMTNTILLAGWPPTNIIIWIRWLLKH
jgi:UDP-galactopyranose mutase